MVFVNGVFGFIYVYDGFNLIIGVFVLIFG